MAKKRPDPQVWKVYRSEKAATKLAGDGGAYAGIADCQTIVDSLVGSKWFLKRWPSIAGVKVFDGKGHDWSRSETYTGGVAHISQFRLLPNNRNLADIVHELGHTVTDAEEFIANPEEREAKKWQDHGPQFCHNLLLLCDRFMPWAYTVVLRKEFRRRGVKFR